MVMNNFIVSALMLIIYLLSVESASIHAANLSKKNQILYRRYIRRQPPNQPSDLYIDEIVEIFHTKQKPSSMAIMTDEDVDKFIYCDFNRQLDECKIYWESRKFQKPTITATQKTKAVLTTKIPTITTTKTPAVVETTTSKVEPTTTPIDSTIPTTTSIQFNIDLPRLPDILEDVNDDIDQNSLNKDVDRFYDNVSTNDENYYVNEDENENN